MRDRYVKGLEALGWREIKSKSSKYRTFKMEGVNFLHFVGKAGAVRAGLSVSRSHPVPEAAKRCLLKAAE